MKRNTKIWHFLSHKLGFLAVSKKGLFVLRAQAIQIPSLSMWSRFSSGKLNTYSAPLWYVQELGYSQNRQKNWPLCLKSQLSLCSTDSVPRWYDIAKNRQKIGTSKTLASLPKNSKFNCHSVVHNLCAKNREKIGTSIWGKKLGADQKRFWSAGNAGSCSCWGQFCCCWTVFNLSKLFIRSDLYLPFSYPPTNLP